MQLGKGNDLVSFFQATIATQLVAAGGYITVLKIIQNIYIGNKCQTIHGRED